MKLRSTQAGTSLIEILVSMVVFGVGLAGSAALSLTSLRGATDGYFVSQATILSYELADTMRGNIAGYEVSGFASTPASAPDICTPEAECTPEEQSQYDVGTWLIHVADVLPVGTALICMDSTPDDGQPEAPACDGAGLNTIKIFWFDRSTQEGLGEGESFHRLALSLVP
jgi:type IV pilus assembly protein PilV